MPGAFPVIFDSERIRLHIVGDSLEVRGTYFLLCRERTTSFVPLFYPFPRDSLLGGARMVSVRARLGKAGDEPVVWEALPGPSGVRWRVPPCSADTIEIEAVYRQKLLTRYARYIVTTTRAWQRPLRHAAFEIHLPAGARPSGFSFPFADKKLAGEEFYFYEADGFYPDRDITVTWE